MNPNRLRWLLVIMGALIGLRLLVPDAPEQVAVSEAVVRPPTHASRGTEVTPVAALAALPDRPSAQIDVPGNAFAVRTQAVPVPAPVPVSAKTTVVAPPVPQPQVTEPLPAPLPPPPPFKVIGTWDDKLAPGVFVSTPVGAQLARKGSVLLAEYRVTAITAHQLSLEHMSSKREYQFNVPRAAGQ